MTDLGFPSLAPVAVALFLALLLFALGAAHGVRRARRARSLAVRTRAGRAVVGEREAAALLEAHGFRVEGRQVIAGYDLRVNGAPVPVELRADYVVTRAGARFVAEVKTGAVAPSLGTAATRRQLLEYRLAFDVDGVLLVDAEARHLHLVEFPLAEPDAPRPGRLLWPWAAAVLALGLVLWTLGR